MNASEFLASLGPVSDQPLTSSYGTFMKAFDTLDLEPNGPDPRYSALEIQGAFTRILTLASHRLPDRWTPDGTLFTLCSCRDGKHWTDVSFDFVGADDGGP